MKAKHARMLIASRVARWLASIEDETVRILAEANTIVTGGCITSMLLNEEVKDFDIYFRTQEAAFAVAKYYVERFKKNPPTLFAKNRGEVQISVEKHPDRVKLIVMSAGIAGESGAENYEYFETLPGDAGDDAIQQFTAQAMQNVTGLDEHADGVIDEESNKPSADKEKSEEEKKLPRYRPVFLSSNAITLSDKIQIVTRFFGEPSEIHDNYDFVHCCNYWTSWEKKLVLRQDALEAILAKELRYVGSKYPICSVIRARKFIKRGWNINAGQYLKMAFQIAELDLTRIDVLEEQLVGVDAAYFSQLIDALRKRNADTVDSSYVTTLLDRIF